MKRLLYLPTLLLLSMVSSFSVWNIGIRNPFRTRLSIPQHNPICSIKTSKLSTKLQASNTDENFDQRLRKAYEEWSLTYGDTIDESRMEIFSYHFMMAENYFKETGNRIKLNEYADLTAVEFQRLKEMGGMIQDVGGSGESNNNSPHWAPEDAAQMDFFAKQTSQRRQAFQDNSQQPQPETPQPPPGYFSVLPTPEGGGDPNAAGMGGGMNNGMGNAASGFNNGMQATENNPGMGGMGGFGSQPPLNGGAPGGDPSAAGVSSFRDPYQQRFTQSYLDSLNTAAKEELVDQTPRPDQPPPPETQDQNNMYNYGVGNNGNDNEQNKYKQPDGFPPENSADKPELQDLINSRYDGIGFLEDSAMVDNAGMDYKFFPALSKMYNLDYPDQEQQNQQDLPPPPPPGMPGQGMGGDGFVPPPPPQGEPTPQERRETFMNAMSTLYSQMFNEDGGPPDADAFAMMQDFMQQASGGVPPPVAGGPPPGQFGVPPQPGTFGGGGAPAGKWSAETSAGPQMADEDLYAEDEPLPPPLQDEEEVGTEIYLGEMSYKMTRGRVIEWLKNIGDEVERGEPLCVVESDTFMMVDGQKYAETHDVVAQEDGVLAAIYIEETETVPVGSVLGVVAADIAEASLVRQTLEQKRTDFEEPSGASTSSSRRNEPEEVFLDENGYPVDADGYLLDSVEVDEEGYPIYDYVDGYPVDEDGYFIEEPEVDADGYPIEDGYDENGYEYEEGGYEEAGYEEGPIPDDGFGAESMYTGPVDDDPDLPSWVLGDAPSIAPAKVASKYPVIPKMGRPAPPPPPPKKVASRTPKRSAPKGGRRPGPKRPRGRIDDVRSPARKKAAEKPKIEGTELTLSELSYGMTKGTVIEWIKNVGDRVTKGEPLAVVESDTFMMIDGQKYAESHDVEASQDGILAATYAGVKETLEVGAVLGIIADNEMAARNVPQYNPYASGAAGAADGPDKPMSRTQRAVAEAIQASSDPEHRARGAAENGFLDSVEQMEEDYLSQMGGGASQQNDEFAQRFMTQEEKESADFAAAGAYDGGGGGGGEQYSNAALDDPDLPSWVRGDAPSLAPAKVASKFPVIPKMGQPGAGNSPSVNAINKAREATMKQESEMYDNIAPPPGRSAPAPRGSAGPPKRRGAPPKRRGAPPKRRGERPSGRGRIDDTRAPLNKPQEDQGTEIVLSELSYGMKKGMIIEWLKNVGDPVKKGDPIAVVESDTFMVIDTQKYAESHDILATDDGILAAQYGGPKELFDVGAVLGMIASSEADLQSMRRSSPPPPSQADANEYANGYADASSFVPEESNEPGETYYPPPDPEEAAAAAGENYLDDPDLPSWVRGDAPSIAPAKVASKFPVIPNMRRGATPPASTPPRTPPAPVNGGTQRRIPKGRYDDTRARPKQIRVEDPSKRKRPRGRIDDVRAPLDSGGGSSYAGGSSYSAPPPSESTSSFFPDLSKSESSKATNKGTPKSTEAPEPEEPRFMPDLSSTLKPKKKKKKKTTSPKKEAPKKPPSPPPAPVVDTKKDKDSPPEPVVEEPVEETIVAEEEEKEELPEPVTDESEDLIEEDVVDVVEDASQDSEEEDVVEEGEGEGAVLETDEETMVDAVDEIEVEEMEEVDEDSESEEINGEYDEEAAETEVEEEEVVANGDSESPVEEEEVVEEDVVMEESEDVMEEDINANVTAKVDIRELKKEKTAEKPGESEGFDFEEATVNSTEAMVQEILVTAKARTAAEAAKIDLTAIQGTGESGCITLDDVKLAIARKKPKIGIRFLTDKPKGRPKK